LFGEGLRKLLQRSDSKFIPYLRKGLSLDFRGSAANEDKNYKRRGWIKKGIGASLVLILMSSLYVSNLNNIRFNHVEAGSRFSIDFPNNVIIGTEESEKMATFIEESLKGLGLQPLSEDGYITKYDTKNIYVPESIDFKLILENDVISLKDGKDFGLLSFGDLSLKGSVYDATKLDLFTLENLDIFSDRFVVIDSKFYTDDAVRFFINKIMKESMAKGVLVIGSDKGRMPNSIGEDKFDGIVVQIAPEIGKTILNNKNCNIVHLITVLHLYVYMIVLLLFQHNLPLRSKQHQIDWLFH